VSGKRDQGRDALDHAITDATQRIERHRGQFLRALCGGVSWRDERVVRSLEQLRRALADRAVTRELFRELHQIDTAGGGEWELAIERARQLAEKFTGGAR